MELPEVLIIDENVFQIDNDINVQFLGKYLINISLEVS